MKSHSVRKECLKEGNTLTFQKAKNLAKAEESAETQLRDMDKTAEVNLVKKYTDRGATSKSDNYNKASQQDKDKKCYGCGHNIHPRGQCPARDIQCHFCHKLGHFAKVCIAKKKREDKASTK
jgi:hypothetical protein